MPWGERHIMEADRVEQFKSDIEAMKLRTGGASREGPLQIVGALLMVVGIVLGVVGYSSSLNTDVSVKGHGKVRPTGWPSWRF